MQVILHMLKIIRRRGVSIRVTDYDENQNLEKEEKIIMNILLSCAGGMSSSMIAKSLEDEGKKQGQDFHVKATYIEDIKEKMEEKKWDIILLAPQVRYHHPVVEKEVGNALPVVDIEGIEYTPMGASQLYTKVMNAINAHQK